MNLDYQAIEEIRLKILSYQDKVNLSKKCKK